MRSPDHRPDPTLLPLPERFVGRLGGVEELLVSSRDRYGRGRVRMWFAISSTGHLYLLTPAMSLKARRWQEDPWVRLTVPETGLSQEAELEPVGADEAMTEAPVLVQRFQMAGATTPEALRWMLESGSHLLLRVGTREAPPP